MTNETGGLAFPLAHDVPPTAGNERSIRVETGMTLRDYFAAKALPAILSREDGGIQSYNPHSQCGEDRVAAEMWAEHAYRIADAMLAERAK